eukprot:c9720_g1_i1.p1 GENE.c9720_g1_i1~~c9720_g1_i1.p1  ORF type:complete len:343 (-),score=85.07 c9720_g1_i1:166-1149(-)
MRTTNTLCGVLFVLFLLADSSWSAVASVQQSTGFADSNVLVPQLTQQSFLETEVSSSSTSSFSPYSFGSILFVLPPQIKGTDKTCSLFAIVLFLLSLADVAMVIDSNSWFFDEFATTQLSHKRATPHHTNTINNSTLIHAATGLASTSQAYRAVFLSFLYAFVMIHCTTLEESEGSMCLKRRKQTVYMMWPCLFMLLVGMMSSRSYALKKKARIEAEIEQKTKENADEPSRSTNPHSAGSTQETQLSANAFKGVNVRREKIEERSSPSPSPSPSSIVRSENHRAYLAMLSKGTHIDHFSSYVRYSQLAGTALVMIGVLMVQAIVICA